MLAVVLALPGLSLGPPSGSRHAQPRHQQPRLCAPSAQLSGFLDEVQQSLSNGSLVKLTLSGNDAQQRAAEDDPLHRLKRIEGRSVQLKKGLRLQLTLKYEYRDTCVNVKLPELGESLAGWLRPPREIISVAELLLLAIASVSASQQLWRTPETSWLVWRCSWR